MSRPLEKRTILGKKAHYRLLAARWSGFKVVRRKTENQQESRLDGGRTKIRVARAGDSLEIGRQKSQGGRDVKNLPFGFSGSASKLE